MLTILSFIGVSAASFGLMSAILLAEIPWVQGTGNDADDGLMLFAPLTNAIGPCFLGGALSSYDCIVGGTHFPRNDESHPKSAFRYYFGGRYMLLRCFSCSPYQMRSDNITYIAWVKGSNVKLLELDRPHDKFTISISSGRLEFQASYYYNGTIIENVQAHTLYKVAIVYNGTHVVANIDGNQTSQRIAGEQRMGGSVVDVLTVGTPLVYSHLGTDIPRLSLFCLQVWNKALTGAEISSAFRRCDKWRSCYPLPAVTSSTTFAAYEKSLNQRCDQASGAELTTANWPQQVTPRNANDLATPFATDRLPVVSVSSSKFG